MDERVKRYNALTEAVSIIVRQRATAIALLKEVQWGGWPGPIQACPHCGQKVVDGHDTFCAIGNFLEEVEE